MELTLKDVPLHLILDQEQGNVIVLSVHVHVHRRFQVNGDSRQCCFIVAPHDVASDQRPLAANEAHLVARCMLNH